MARIADVKREDLSTRQQQLYDDIMRTRPRSGLSGPFSVWIHTPDIAEPADRLANCFRVNPKLDKRLIELIVLLMCRAGTVKYAWSVHEPLARQAGLTPETIDAIRARRRPDFERDDERPAGPGVPRGRAPGLQPARRGNPFWRALRLPQRLHRGDLGGARGGPAPDVLT